MNTYDYGPLPSESPSLDTLTALIRTDPLGDHDVLAMSVTTVVYTALMHTRAGLPMTPEQIGACAALMLVDRGGFHRRHLC